MSTTLLSVAELNTHLEDGNLRIFDCRHDLRSPDYGTQAYARGHIPGAQFLHLDRDLSGATNGLNGRHPLPEREVFAATLSRYGVSANTQVVAYDNEGGIFAARLWWMLRWMGHFQVAVLDGGLAAWKMAKLPLSQEATLPAAADFAMRSGDQPLLAEEVLAHLDSAAMLLLDARAPDRFSGEKETLDPVGGHIAGAINRFFADNLDENGIFFKPAAELATEYFAILAGRNPGSVVQTCGSGVTACHNLLAMEIAGLQGSRLYPGSWSEWCADPTRPIIQGDS